MSILPARQKALSNRRGTTLGYVLSRMEGRPIERARSRPTKLDILIPYIRCKEGEKRHTICVNKHKCAALCISPFH